MSFQNGNNLIVTDGQKHPGSVGGDDALHLVCLLQLPPVEGCVFVARALVEFLVEALQCVHIPVNGFYQRATERISYTPLP